MEQKAQLILVLLISLVCYAGRAQDKYFKNWPKGSAPQEVGRKLSHLFLSNPHANFGSPTPPTQITYPEVCTWYGALRYAAATADRSLQRQLEERFRPLLYEKKNLQPRPDHVDHSVFGSIPLELYRQTKNPVYLDMGQWFANQQWNTPSAAKAEQLVLSAQGFSWQSRLWIDDMYMISNLQVQAYRATRQPGYFNRAANQMAFYLDSLQKPNGLFFHAPDAPFFWGRGNGWMAAGMTELLSSLPKIHPQYNKIKISYLKMMASLKKYQNNEGMWLQLVDDPQSWPESSASAMFAFAFITGVKMGWLPEEEYGPSARKAWIALNQYLDGEGNLREVCQGTNKASSRQYYLDRKRLIGDMHGQAPMLWCSFALLHNSK